VLCRVTLWHLQKVLQYIKYIILEFTLSTIFFYPPLPPFLEGLHILKRVINSQAQWHASVIPATQEVEIGWISVQDLPGQKATETPSQLIFSALCLIPVIPATLEAMGGRIMI
jgi:hypothetical protein